MENSTNNPTDFNISELIKPYVSKISWFIISVIICVFFAFLYIKSTTPIYNVKSEVLIKDAKKSLNIGAGDIGVLEGLSGFGGMSTNSIENEIEIFKTRNLIRDVVSLNHLEVVIYSKLGLKTKELYGDTSPIVIHVISEKKNKKFPKQSFKLYLQGDKLRLKSDEYDFDKEVLYNRLISLPFANILITKNNNFDAEKAETISNELEVIISSLEASTSAIQKLLEVDLVDKDGTIIGLSINSTQVDKAKLIINQLIEAYNRDAISDKNSESKKTKDFIDDRIGIISKDLGIIETEKEHFKNQYKITDITAETKVNLETSALANQKLVELESQLELTNNLISYLNKQKNYQPLPSIGLDNIESGNAISTYNRLILERNRLLENATLENPLVVEVSNQIQIMKRSVVETLNKSKLGLELSLNEYNSQQNSLDSRLAKVPLQEKLFRGLERQQQIKENLYLLLLQKREETAISLAVVAPKARVIESSYASDKPVSPKKLIVLLVSLVVGVLIPFVIIYVKELFNTKVISKNDIKNFSDIPVSGEIPKLKKNEDHLVKINDFSPLAESFRILSTNIGFMLSHDFQSHVILVTSSVKGEGKTFISMNLALTLSNSKKVVVIGADIRNPQLQRYDAKYSTVGITEFLYDNTITVDDIIFKNPINNKSDIIYSGKIPPNPTDLLKNGRWQVLIDELRKMYDYIIVDSAPLLLVTDTFVISNMSDLVLYVTRSHFSERSFIDFANDSVSNKKLKNVSFVLNDINKINSSYGNKYGYGYNNK